MVYWTTGEPNARFRILQLLKTNFVPGDKIVKTSVDTKEVYALGFIGSGGAHKLLLVSKRNHDIRLTLPQPARKVEYVDQTTRGHTTASRTMNSTQYVLPALAVAIVTLQ